MNFRANLNKFIWDWGDANGIVEFGFRSIYNKVNKTVNNNKIIPAIIAAAI